MVALQIRDVPSEVREALAERARAQGQSLQAFLLSLVEAEARRSANRELLNRFGARDDGSRLSADDAAAAVHAAREERAAELLRKTGLGGSG